MCFAPEADLAAGIAVGAVGVDALRHVRRRQDLALASLPALFAAHQVSEAFVWWGLTDELTYHTSAAHGGLLAGIYAVVVCGALLASSHRAIVVFGVVNALAVAALTWAASTALTSLWCLWAAVTSGAISAHVRRAAHLPDVAATSAVAVGTGDRSWGRAGTTG